VLKLCLFACLILQHKTKQQMKKITLNLLITVMTSLAIFSGCKKGEGDPFLSLRSRKGRVAGEWTASAGSGTSSASTTLGSTVTTNTSSWTFDGTRRITTDEDGNKDTTNITFDYTFEKEGTFSINSIETLEQSFGLGLTQSTTTKTTTTGTWDFNEGVGELKGKSQLLLYTESEVTENTITNNIGTTVTANTETYSGTTDQLMKFDIYQLKKDEMIVRRDGGDGSSNSLTTYSTTNASTTEWTFTAK